MAGPRARGTVAQRLATAARTAFSALRDAHPSEHFYFFALFTTDAGEYVTTTAWSEEAFARVDNRDFRFWPAESPHHSTHGALFDDFNPGSRLHEACFAALGILDAEGFFGVGAARANVILNVVYGDMSDEQWLAHAQRLNPPEAVAAALPYLRLHLPEGDVKQWGARVYQVSGLSLSSDRRVVAYTGMGGEVGILVGRYPLDAAGPRASHGCRTAPSFWWGLPTFWLPPITHPAPFRFSAATTAKSRERCAGTRPPTRLPFHPAVAASAFAPERPSSCSHRRAPSSAAVGGAKRASTPAHSSLKIPSSRPGAT